MTFDNLLTISLVVLILPIISFVLIIFNQKRLGRGAGWLGTSFLFVDFVLSAIIAYNKLILYPKVPMLQWKFDWFSLGTSTIQLGVGIDNLAAIMLIVVTLISLLVHLFSTEYMREDKRFPRFYAYLGLFTFSMLGIVIANNFLNMYIFWELVGISSYLLIGFWYEKDSASNAGKKAFIANRVGDLGFLAGILICFFTFNTFMFDEIYASIANGVVPFGSGTVLTIAGICLFMGAIGKSAQFPLHVWLPDAMEGPTPVSALIHAATMVAAGVYLTARIFPMLSADALVFVAYVGAITAFLSATIAITQNDFKKVLAYSTVSQLGFMIMGIGVGAWSLGFFHLVTHAWFKACLFLASGSVIHAMHVSMHHANDHHTDPQDIRNMGGLRKTMPITYITFLFATIAIAGVPFTSGFLSKDGILAGTLAFGNLSGHWFIPIAGFSAAFMTAFYMFRLCIEAFHGKSKTSISLHTKETKFPIVLPLIVLAALSFWFVYSANPFDASKGWFLDVVTPPANIVPAEYQFDFITPNGNLSSRLEEISSTASSANNTLHSGTHLALNTFETEMHHQHVPAMILSLIIAGCGILLAFVVYQWKKINPNKVANSIKPLYNLSYNKWYIDEIYEKSFIGGTVFLSKIMSWFDTYIIDGIVNASAKILNGLAFLVGKFDNIVIDGIVNFIAWIIGVFGGLGRKIQTGSVQTYIALSLIGLMTLIYFII